MEIAVLFHFYPTIVIPAKAGIQIFAKNVKFPIFAESFLDLGVRRDDEISDIFIAVLK